MAFDLTVIWRNIIWDDPFGHHHGWVPGHEDHCHLEVPAVVPQAQDLIVVVGHWFQRHGYRVGEHPQFGGVTPGIHHGLGHAEGRAVDVNFGPGGENDIEKAAFDGLIPRYVNGQTTLSFFEATIPEVTAAELQAALKPIQVLLQGVIDAQHGTSAEVAKRVSTSNELLRDIKDKP